MNKNFITEFSKYFFASGIAFTIDVGILYGLTEFFGVHYLGSAAIGFTAGLITIYFISIYWIFGERKMKNRQLEFSIFAFIGVIGLGINEVVLWVFTEMFLFHYLASKLVSAGIVYFWNFFARKYTLFKYNEAVTETA